MATRHSFRPGRLLIPAICAAITGYFGYHGVMGFQSLQLQQARIVALESDLAAIRDVRAVLAHRVGLLRPGSLDPDMLDQQARAAVNAADERDIVIFRNPSSPYGGAGFE